jgi:sugar lactone lactonase YvrE
MDVSSTQPLAFAAGDIIVASTDVDDSNVDLRNHAGEGRLLHMDASFVHRATLWTGTHGLVIGLAVEPVSGMLYAADAQAYSIVAFAADGSGPQRLDWLPRRRFGALLPDGQGGLWLGVHSRLGEPPSDEWGETWLFHADPVTRRVRALDVEVDGGMRGFHCVTHMALEADGRTLRYVSEGGRRVMRVDLEGGGQLADFLRLPEDDPRSTCGIATLHDGGLVMATGKGCCRLSAEGQLVEDYAVPAAPGWSRVTLADGGEQFFLNNFFTGVVETRTVDGGRVLARHDIGRKYSLCGLVEYPAR